MFQGSKNVGDEEHFKMISEWYHNAILELIAVQGFKPSAENIAHALNISVTEAENALNRLLHFNMITLNSEGQWLNTAGNTTTLSIQNTNQALKQLQINILSNAQQAIQNIPINKRDQSAVTFAFDEELIDDVKTKLKEFRRSLADYLQAKSKNKTNVYQLTMSLFPISHCENNKKDLNHD